MRHDIRLFHLASFGFVSFRFVCRVSQNCPVLSEHERRHTIKQTRPNCLKVNPQPSFNNNANSNCDSRFAIRHSKAKFELANPYKRSHRVIRGLRVRRPKPIRASGCSSTSANRRSAAVDSPTGSQLNSTRSNPIQSNLIESNRVESSRVECSRMQSTRSRLSDGSDSLAGSGRLTRRRRRVGRADSDKSSELLLAATRSNWPPLRKPPETRKTPKTRPKLVQNQSKSMPLRPQSRCPFAAPTNFH